MTQIFNSSVPIAIKNVLGMAHLSLSYVTGFHFRKCRYFCLNGETSLSEYRPIGPTSKAVSDHDEIELTYESMTISV